MYGILEYISSERAQFCDQTSVHQCPVVVCRQRSANQHALCTINKGLWKIPALTADDNIDICPQRNEEEREPKGRENERESDRKIEEREDSEEKRNVDTAELLVFWKIGD